MNRVFSGLADQLFKHISHFPSPEDKTRRGETTVSSSSLVFMITVTPQEEVQLLSMCFEEFLSGNISVLFALTCILAQAIS